MTNMVSVMLFSIGITQLFISLIVVVIFSIFFTLPEYEMINYTRGAALALLGLGFVVAAQTWERFAA